MRACRHARRTVFDLVLLERIELSTSPLPRECSTSELQQHDGCDMVK